MDHPGVAKRFVRWVRHRLRILLVVGLIAAVASLAAMTLLRHFSREPIRTYSLDCLPFQPPKTVPELNNLVAGYRTTSGFVGADVGATRTLQDGRTLWVFGDTLRADTSDFDPMVRNSMLITDGSCATAVMPKDHGAAIPDRADGVGYWPMDLEVFHSPGTDHVGVSLQRVRTTGSGVFDFEILGPSVAIFDVPADQPPYLVAVHDLGADDPDPTKPMWGAALSISGDYVYIYGTRAEPDSGAFGRDLLVARSLIGQVTDQSTWRYWNGHRWQRRPDRAAVLIPAQGGVSTVLSVFHRGDAWYAVSKRDEFLGRDLVIWKAPAPTGPFVAGEPVAAIPSECERGVFCYMALAHEDLLPEPGTVVVSYSRNATDFSRLLKDPAVYRPVFLRVPLP